MRSFLNRHLALLGLFASGCGSSGQLYDPAASDEENLARDRQVSEELNAVDIECLKGVVRTHDAIGTPISGASVEIRHDDEVVRELVTNSAGNFDWCTHNLPSSFELVVHKEGFDDSEQFLTQVPGSRIEIRLEEE